LTYALFEQVSIDVQRWCASGYNIGRVAVNVAGDTLHDGELLDRLAAMIDRLPEGCEGLDVEITENIAIGNNIEETEAVFKKIQGLGVRIAIDDFGTGYASLQTLLDMPIDILKIDRSFVLPMAETGEGNEVVSAMISLSKKLNKYCVVEGVETQWQWQQLAHLGADELQGFHFFKPASADEIANVLSGWDGLKLTA
jgi:EAL domain-containing protein (putative c-di-GMP-specific phosphodiesterase class I)